jgi:hypothetical protein
LVDEQRVRALELLAGGQELGGAGAHGLLEYLVGLALLLEQDLVAAADLLVGGDVAVGLDEEPPGERRGGQSTRNPSSCVR